MPRWSESSAPTGLPLRFTPNRLFALQETLQDGQTRSRYFSDSESIWATTFIAATAASQVKPMEQMLTAAGYRAFITVPSGASTWTQRLMLPFQSISPPQRKV